MENEPDVDTALLGEGNNDGTYAVIMAKSSVSLTGIIDSGISGNQVSETNNQLVTLTDEISSSRDQYNNISLPSPSLVVREKENGHYRPSSEWTEPTIEEDEETDEFKEPPTTRENNKYISKRYSSVGCNTVSRITHSPSS